MRGSVLRILAGAIIAIGGLVSEASAATATVASAPPASPLGALQSTDDPDPTVAAKALETVDSVRVLVVYHSRTGNTEQMAEAVAAAASTVPGVAVTLRRVEEATNADVERADAIIVGSPTHWANVAAPVIEFITGWPDVVDKVGGAFSTGGAPSGGKEHVTQSLVLAMLNHGMIVAGPVYVEDDGYRFGAFGASATTGPADPGVDESELEEARQLGERVARLAVRLVGER